MLVYGNHDSVISVMNIILKSTRKPICTNFVLLFSFVGLIEFSLKCRKAFAMQSSYSLGLDARGSLLAFFTVGQSVGLREPRLHFLLGKVRSK